MSQKYKYIFIDWDGCLAKTLDLWLKAYKQTLTELHINKSDKEITAVFGDWQGGTRLGAPDNEKFFARVDELIKEEMPTVDLYENVSEVIDVLKNNNFILVVLSSSLRDYIIPAMRYHKIEHLFDLVISGENVTKHKPDPESIYLAIKKFDAELSKTVMIGDSDKDILAAKNAGIDSVLFYPPEHDIFYDNFKLIKTGPSYVSNSYKNILELLLNE